MHPGNGYSRIGGHRASPGARSWFVLLLLNFQNVLLGLFLTAAFVLGLSLYMLAKHKPVYIHEHSAPASLEELYGNGSTISSNSSGSGGSSGSSSSSGPYQLLLLSYFSSRASLLARLLMLMGVFAGDGSQLRIDSNNWLRWWELQQVTSLNDLLLTKYAAPGLPPSLGRGFNASAMSRDDQSYYADRVEGVVRYLGQHKPWLLKDPRLAWFAPLWMERLEAPGCILIVHPQPALLAQELGNWQPAHGEVEVSPYTHLERWTNSTLSALQACLAVPTIIVPSTVLEPPLLQPFLGVLQQHLQLAGVQGTAVPSDWLLEKHYTSHLSSSTHTPALSSSHKCNSAAAAGHNGTVSGTALLLDSCNWLPPMEGWPGVVELPIPTRALVDALREHLESHLAHPKAGFQYSRVAGALYSSYTSRVKQFVQSGHGGSKGGDHQGIAALVADALQFVATEFYDYKPVHARQQP